MKIFSVDSLQITNSVQISVDMISFYIEFSALDHVQNTNDIKSNICCNQLFLIKLLDGIVKEIIKDQKVTVMGVEMKPLEFSEHRIPYL